MDPAKKHDTNDLNAIYKDAESCDDEVFAHQRSNILLISGEHYTRLNSRFINRIRSTSDLPQDQKLRLTMNHVQRITEIISSDILSAAPGVTVSPKNMTEIQDQKAAELHHSVWRDGVEKNRLEDRIVEWIDDFTGIGEIAVKVFWDPSAGPIKAFNQKLSAEGKPLFLDMSGEETEEPGIEIAKPEGESPEGEVLSQPQYAVNHAPAPGVPVYQGGFVFEDIYGFNLLRDPNAKRMEESEYLIIRKMVDIDKLMAMVGDDEEKKKFVKASRDETFMVFDTQKNTYRREDKQAMVKEFYFRPCAKYPKGWFYIVVGEGTIFEGELPGGIFPIIFQYYRRIQTTPRGYSIVKVLRPYQAEINRASSKMAEHQITLGDDKLLIQNGTKVTQGNALPGVRSINYTGMPPGILEGRSGAQYLEYINAKISEMYQAANLPDETAQKDSGQMDPMALLFRAASQKKRFAKPTMRFERFLKDLCRTYLQLAKIHMPEDAVIRAIGRDEQVNITEFKNSNDLSYEVTVEAESEDIETKMGRQIVLSQTLQYAGGQLSPEDIGEIVNAMPWANDKEILSGVTANAELAKNTILALDRGQMPTLRMYDDHAYLLKKLGARTQKPDFQYLPPPIQMNYQTVISQHEQAQAQIQAQLKAMEADYIPIGGAMIACDLYINDPTQPQKTPRRARVPYQALDWLMQRLEQQGASLSKLEGMSDGMSAQMGAQSQVPPGNQQGSAPMDSGRPPMPMGQENPGGVAYGNAGTGQQPEQQSGPGPNPGFR